MGAMCVQHFNDQFVLRFTFLLAVRFGLPRPASQVIHRSELCTRSKYPGVYRHIHVDAVHLKVDRW